MNIQNLLVQVAFLYAPFLHCQMEQVTPTIYRGPDPKMKDLSSLHDKGIKTIISLRTNPERKKAKECEKLGMKWVQIKTGVFKTPTADQFDQFRQIVNDPKRGPVYVSCEIDMDRTGVYLATYRMCDQHWTAQQMVDEFHAHHQKKWWPIFRKYEGVVLAYAKTHQSADSTICNSDAVKTGGKESGSVKGEVVPKDEQQNSAKPTEKSEVKKADATVATGNIAAKP